VVEGRDQVFDPRPAGRAGRIRPECAQFPWAQADQHQPGLAADAVQNFRLISRCCGSRASRNAEAGRSDLGSA